MLGQTRQPSTERKKIELTSGTGTIRRISQNLMMSIGGPPNDGHMVFGSGTQLPCAAQTVIEQSRSSKKNHGTKRSTAHSRAERQPRRVAFKPGRVNASAPNSRSHRINAHASQSDGAY